jgi:hypothetical protein
VCGNGDLIGSKSGHVGLDQSSASLLGNMTSRWCTDYNVPNPNVRGTGGYSKQHFARMWYELLLVSDNFFGLTQGQDDPYSWTTGAGYGYDMGGSRYSFTGKTEQDILHNASRLVYSIDEGSSIGAVNQNILIGGARPAIGEYDFENPLKEVTVLQTLYSSLAAKDIVKRVLNCNRPGGPVGVTLADAESILKEWKEAMEISWNRGWNNVNNGEVQFVSFFDDGGGAAGSTGRLLKGIKLENNSLTAVAMIGIALFSILFFYSMDAVESRVLISTVGVGLVVLSYSAGLGYALLVNTEVSFPCDDCALAVLL